MCQEFVSHLFERQDLCVERSFNCLNGFGGISKWFFASVMLPPLRVSAVGNRPDQGFSRQAMNAGGGCCKIQDSA